MSPLVSELAAEFISRPQSQEVVEGEKAEFTCSVSKETYEVKWLKDNKELEAGDKYQMVSDGKKRTLFIKNCELKDEGGYVVMIGPTRASAGLTVRGKPHSQVINCAVLKKELLRRATKLNFCLTAFFNTQLHTDAVHLSLV